MPCSILLSQNSENVLKNIKNNKIKLKDIDFNILLKYPMIFEEDIFYVYINNDNSSYLEKILTFILTLFNKDSRIIKTFNYIETNFKTVTLKNCKSVLESLYEKDNVSEEDIKKLKISDIKISTIFANESEKFLNTNSNPCFKIKVNQQNIENFLSKELSIQKNEYKLSDIEKFLLTYTFFLLKVSRNRKTNNKKIILRLSLDKEKKIEVYYEIINDLLDDDKKSRQKIENYSFIFNEIKNRNIFKYLTIEI